MRSASAGSRHFAFENSQWRATMPAMRFIMSALPLLALLTATPALGDDKSANDGLTPLVRPDAFKSDSPKSDAAKSDIAKPDLVKESGPGPLATGEQRLDSLYERLKKERSTEAARGIANEIRTVYAISGSATVDFLMQNSAKAINDKRYGAALDFLDQVTLLSPSFAEGWNRRATLHYLLGNYPKAMSDSARVLALEPRHLHVLAGIAGILQETGRDQQALRAWEKYLSYYPADREAQSQVIELTNKLAGQKT
jgi:tetratricopeptide (TPR) repeat protein